MGFVFAIKYAKNAVDLSCEFKTSSQNFECRKGALVNEPISQNNPLLAEVEKVL